MASAEQLKALLKSHMNGDDSQFLSVAMQVAAHEAKLGHGKLAEELRDMVDAAKARRPIAQPGKLVQLGQPRGELATLLSASYPATRVVDMVLDHSVENQLHRILREQRQFAKIREHGLSPRRKLLLVGPPGSGKTMTASALAGELGVPLFLVRLDALITKFMGETAAKLRQVFDAIADVRGVYFFDEFDAIGSQRGLANDVGEIRRVLNSFLQMIEHDHSSSLIIAATNHPEILDYALFRRFDDVIEYKLPGQEQVITLLNRRLGKFKPKKFNLKRAVGEAEMLSYAELCRAVDESIKEVILHDGSAVSEGSLISMLHERKLISAKLTGNQHKELPTNDGTAKR
ncbi:SpoVK/Ycf46/Vps4 family AAA+-type ATPase [Duganella sp. 1411]|uniref:AAA family ATPase n=1 Tax=Duganella sp. 1411 TaxID=2806572 RepID=UPI001AE22657|nr:AAA family ATPase [Duganella sp. 1411]MBP1206185.1 SpoVK/Ycf46/Vps4 family AAA+-type ATPase [Duganella sp. 1411]